MLLSADSDYNVGDNPVLKFLRRHMRVTEHLHGERFLVRQIEPRTGRSVLYATPLLLTLVMVELADALFAVDSIPAIFAITTERSEEHTSELQSIMRSSYDVFCLKRKK